MTAEKPRQEPATAGRRRSRYALQSVVLVLAVGACCLFAGVIAARVGPRIDVTATREHRLSERTQAVLGRLDGDYEIIAAVRLSGVDAGTAQRTVDVLDTIARQSDRVNFTLLDTGSTGGVTDFRETMERLSRRFESDIRRQQEAIEAALAEADTLRADLLALVEPFENLAEQAGATDSANARAASNAASEGATLMKLWARALEEAASASRIQLGSTLGAAPVPPLDEAARALREPMERIGGELRTVESNLRAIANPNLADLGEGTADRAGTLAAVIGTLRDRVNTTSQALRDLRRLPILTVARLLERASALVVVGPADGPRGGLTAVEIDALFPPRAPDAESFTVDLRFKAEELVATALATMSGREAPLVVFVHAETTPLAPDWGGLRAVVDRLRLRGMDPIEWNAAQESEPPTAALTRVDPARTRPVVYIVIPVNVQATVPASAQRMSRLAQAISVIIERGESVLLSFEPSTLPNMGAADPMAQAARPLGLEVLTARPLLRTMQTGAGRIVTGQHLLTGAGTESRIGEPVRGLRIQLNWPVPVRERDGVEAAAEPVLLISDAQAWAESDWQNFYALRPEQRRMVTNPPQPDSQLDERTGPWSVGVAVERSRAETGRTQRAVAVGASDWFFDSVTRQPVGFVDGRPVLAAPGNIELFESAVYWLADQTDMIARSATAQATPTIGELSGAQVAAIRWGLIAGLPGFIVLFGLVWRVLRG